MNYIEIALSDGTVARWAVTDDETTDKIAGIVSIIVGQPDTILT
jgi:hypothetical protein